MKKYLTGMVIFILLLTALVPFASAEEKTWPGFGSNTLFHEYINDGRWSQPVYSYLYENPDGSCTRVQYDGKAVAVDLYSRELVFVSGQTIEPELPIFGGFYHGTTHNFLIYGQQNPDEDDGAEVIRVVKYTHDWQRVGDYRLLGANTTIPFDAGSLRCAEYDGILHIRTSHEMYTSDDGLNHQANLMLSVNIEDMTQHNVMYDTFNYDYGYVSHSFNQFIAMDGDQIIAVDHGDAHPRSVALFRYPQDPGGDWYYGRTERVDVLPILGTDGDNDTGVCVGGLAVTESSYLVAGNSVPPDYSSWVRWGQRNVFLTVTPKDDFTAEATTVLYLTDYADDDDITVTNPQLVEVEPNRYLLMWGESKDKFELRFVFVDSQGQLLSEIYSTPLLAPSDCQPIVLDGKVIWYANYSSVPRFMTIDLADPAQVTHECLHSFWFNEEPTMIESGTLGVMCMLCQEAFELEVPAMWSGAYQIEVLSMPDCSEDGTARYSCIYDNGIQLIFTGPYGIDGHMAQMIERVERTCTEDGYDLYRCSDCGLEFKYNHTYSYGGHKYGYWTTPEDYECETMVDRYRECERCGDRELNPTYIGHDYDRSTTPSTCYDDAVLHQVCKHCGFALPDEYFDGDPSNGHSYDEDWQVLREPTCTAGGLSVRYCSECGIPEFMNPRELGHDYLEDICTRCGYERGTEVEHEHVYECWTIDPTCDEPGYIQYWCDCYRSYYTEPVGEPLGHCVVAYIKVYPDCVGDGLRVIGCPRCNLTEYTEALPAVGHEYIDGICWRCSAVEHEHDYVQTETVTPKCQSMGYTAYTCTGCGNSYQTDWVMYPGHDMEPYELEPTCEDWGETGKRCTQCDYTEGRALMALGHEYENGFCTRCGEEHDHSLSMEKLEATCTEPGKWIYVCDCGYTEDVGWEPWPALGHDMQWTVTDPTCTTDGVKHGTCSRCDHQEEEPIPALGHDYLDGVCTICGEAEPGYVHNPFVDVPEGAYYYEPVLWAVQEGITQGVSADHFGPDNQCTRAQVVTFLWRASGSPEPESTDNPFADVPESAYYYKSVLWALENGITQGLSATQFGPDQPCTRAQVVTFLWRAAGKPDAGTGAVPFLDVSADAYYYEPVLWAVEHGITQGMGGGMFGVNGVCSRAQIVTFLYRANN